MSIFDSPFGLGGAPSPFLPFGFPGFNGSGSPRATTANEIRRAQGAAQQAQMDHDFVRFGDLSFGPLFDDISLPRIGILAETPPEPKRKHVDSVIIDDFPQSTHLLYGGNREETLE